MSSPASNSNESLEPPVTAGSETTTASAVDTPGRDIDEYRLIETIGEGGMGVIYKAEQRGAIRRIVALKVIKLGLDTKAVIARFEAERQALALMNHANIARVFGAGSTPLGRPYFVMEYVPGDPITVYCDKHKLSIRQRLELFGQVCDAVQHAHTKGIIHRDLKATNVLVAEIDGKPVPKVIDFGVAKATNQRLTEETLFTQTGQLIGTPAYMSPEQAAGGEDIDTRSDVYALGVLLYELLTGSLPFDPTRLRAAAYGELQRIIREDDPPRPSTFYSTATEASRTAAARRAATVEELAKTLRHELEWIPLHAMRKDRSERYGTAAEFAKDIENYLNGRPLIAAPDSGLYRLRKTLHRHRAMVAAAAAVMLALLLGLAGTSWQAVRAGRAESRAVARATEALEASAEAERQRRDAQTKGDLLAARLERHEAVTNFLNEIFLGLDPAEAQGMNPELLLHALHRAEERLEHDLPRPEDRAGYMHMLGELYHKFGERERAGPLLRRGVELSREVLASAVAGGTVSHAEYEAVRLLVQGCHRLADFLADTGHPEEALVLAREAHDEAQRHLPEDHSRLAICEANLAVALQRCEELEEAVAMWESALDRMEADPESFRPHHRAAHLNNLADLHVRRGQVEAAASAAARADRIYREAGQEMTPEFAEVALNRANYSFRLKKYEEALERLDEVKAVRDVVLTGPHHPARGLEWELRAMTLQRLDRLPEALEALGDALATHEAAADAAAVARATKRMVDYLRRAGREDDAAEYQRRLDGADAPAAIPAGTGP